MDLGTKNANDLISKDYRVSSAAACNVINNCDGETFLKLCEKSEFIFDFLKEKIVKNLINAVNKENLHNVFEFTKIYNADFEDFIVFSWLKFANEDLTDKIFEYFENGTKEQMAYAAAYFSHINDPVALEYLNKFALDDFEPLAQNCALALRSFCDKTLYEKSLKILSDDDFDDFEKYKYLNFLVSYGDMEAVSAIVDYYNKTFAKTSAACALLYLTDFDFLYKNGYRDALKIFDTIIGGYPEEISLDTVFDFNILKFIKFLCGRYFADNAALSFSEPCERSFVKRLLLKAKYKFNLFTKEDIYTFDLNKAVKKELFDISGFLNSIKTELFDELESELKSKDGTRVLEAFDVVLNYGKTEFCPDIARIIETNSREDVVLEGLMVLKTFGKLNLIEKDKILSRLNNENIKAAAGNYFNS